MRLNVAMQFELVSSDVYEINVRRRVPFHAAFDISSDMNPELLPVALKHTLEMLSRDIKGRAERIAGALANPTAQRNVTNGLL